MGALGVELKAQEANKLTGYVKEHRGTYHHPQANFCSNGLNTRTKTSQTVSSSRHEEQRMGGGRKRRCL